ncbi:hypothetical protein [Burkholderia sp. YIM B11467]
MTIDVRGEANPDQSSDWHCEGAVHRLFSDQYEYQDFTDGKGACNRKTENAPFETEIMPTEFATITERRHLIETVCL